ncbi:uncharacterized protein LACBIDRAFT_330180 [Laccaria bicolor S238N-H82]|uniref:Predicted protein n=1 Tax=Laccaria bicolor (strain S238N-H82 / ATCC MYA-4686) TaxID=486041 RepID=B0DKJ9_LACBS|nr:uncharacterized protein LACBIDRAFT_330180 [Laccaria bicolor S238N-H82]EDR04956.1 predicted protein [Laccaria bicolor S238N-H82]|eukprot:XP_001884346.1 predicted protein [Laccaria bicolor S238N-H82]
MGQRHQAFLIARVKSKAHGETPAETRYRCIAALHHQWCYGRLPVKAARRFLTLVKQKDNAQIILEELRNFDNATSSKIPCPYSLFLLTSAWTVDLTPGEEYNSGGSILSAEMGSSDGDNNDGITIIDVTDPENASYCFHESEEDTPINAEGYVRAYYPNHQDTSKEPLDTQKKEEREIEQDVLATIASLDDAPLITIDKLAEAWPYEYRSTRTPPEQVQHEVLQLEAPSLADLSVEPAVNHALEVGQIETLEVLFNIPGKAALIKDALQKQISLPDHATTLVAKIISQEVQKSKELDLSHWALTSEQVVKLVSEQMGVESLCLSHNHHVTKTTVLEVLSAQPTIRKLNLLDTAVTNADMVKLLSENPKLFYSLEAIIHPSFFQWRRKNIHPIVFSHTTSMSQRPGSKTVSLPYFTPGQVVQALTDLLPSADDSMFSNISEGYAVQVAYAASVRKEGCRWAERTVPICLNNSKPALNDGWNFLWLLPSAFSDRSTAKRYAFVLVGKGNHSEPVNDPTGADAASPSSTYDIHDLESFIDILVSEGRPAPSATALGKLSEAFLATSTLLTQQEVENLLKMWKATPQWF